MNLASLLNQVDDIKRMFVEEASKQLSERKQELFGAPPTFDKDTNSYKPGKQPDIEKIKSLLQNYLVY